jgi:hypothetical protein
MSATRFRHMDIIKLVHKAENKYAGLSILHKYFHKMHIHLVGEPWE